MEGSHADGIITPGVQLSREAYQFLEDYRVAVSEMYVYETPGSIPGLAELQAEYIEKLEKLSVRYGISANELKMTRWAGKHLGTRLASNVLHKNTTEQQMFPTDATTQPELL